MKVGKRIGAFLTLLGLLLVLAPLTAVAGGQVEPPQRPGVPAYDECQGLEIRYSKFKLTRDGWVEFAGPSEWITAPADDRVDGLVAGGNYILGETFEIGHKTYVYQVVEYRVIGDPCVPEEPSTTTTILETTTTAPAPLETTFQAFVSCNVDGSFEISVEFGDGMASATVSLSDPMFPVPDVPDGVLIEVGSDTVVRGTVPADRTLEFQIDGVAQDGYVIIPDDSRLLTVEPCPVVSPTTVVPEEPTTTAVSVTTTTVTEDPEVLPFTGIEDFLLPLGGLLVALGGLVLMVVRRSAE